MLINNNIEKELILMMNICIIKLMHISGHEIIASLHNEDIAGSEQQGR